MVGSKRLGLRARQRAAVLVLAVVLQSLLGLAALATGRAAVSLVHITRRYADQLRIQSVVCTYANLRLVRGTYLVIPLLGYNVSKPEGPHWLPLHVTSPILSPVAGPGYGKASACRPSVCALGEYTSRFSRGADHLLGSLSCVFGIT